MIDHHRGTPETKSQNKNNSNLNSWRVNVYTGLSVFFFVDLSNQKYDSDEVNIMKAFYCNQRKCLTYVTVGVFYPFF